MKKTIKFLTVFLLMSVMTLNLCSCKNLDRMRSERAYLSEDANSLEYNGSTYRLLPDNNDLVFLGTDNKSVCVAKKEVPLLLGGTFGSFYRLMNDGEIITNMATSYCKEELYEYYQSVLSEPVLNSYGILYYGYDDITHEYNNKFWLLPEVYSHAVEHAVLTANWEETADYYDVYEKMELYRCDNSGAIGKFSEIYIGADVKPNNEDTEYYLFSYNAGKNVVASVTESDDRETIAEIYEEYLKLLNPDNYKYEYEF